jgi:hypothetical protein
MPSSPAHLAPATLDGAAHLYLVERLKGPAWHRTSGMRQQSGWDQRAAFVDGPAENRFILFGGPAGEGDAETFMFVVDAPDEEAIRIRLAADPWEGSLLVEGKVRPWQLLGAAPVPALGAPHPPRSLGAPSVGRADPDTW